VQADDDIKRRLWEEQAHQAGAGPDAHGATGRLVRRQVLVGEAPLGRGALRREARLQLLLLASLFRICLLEIHEKRPSCIESLHAIMDPLIDT
jgi:hypothetical protein